MTVLLKSWEAGPCHDNALAQRGFAVLGRYMLGDSGRSYVVGFGNNPPAHAHHRGASCPIENGLGSNDPPCDYGNYALPTPNPNTLYGALVGGDPQLPAMAAGSS